MTKSQATAGKKLASALLAFFVLFSVFSISIQRVYAIPVEVLVDVSTEKQTLLERIWSTVSSAVQKAGSIAFQRTLSSTLNKIAYDTATWLGSGGKGQQPQFVTQGYGAWSHQLADEAKGQFVEVFVNNLNTNVDSTCSDKYNQCVDSICGSLRDSGDYLTCISTQVTSCDREATSCAASRANSNTNGKVTPSFNVCSPSSIEAKLKIGLGLVNQNRPQGPNCTLSQLIKNWDTDLTKKWQDLRDPNYLNLFRQVFDPRANDLMTYSIAVGDMQLAESEAKKNAQTDYSTNQGWLDVQNIAGMKEGVPGQARAEADLARKARQEALGKTTNDILVDAANLFLNQLAMSGFNNILRSLGEQATNPRGRASSNRNDDPNSNTGATALREVTTTLLQPKFGVLADYNVISSLSVCLDPKNPGPDSCVIDDRFAQGITEQKTVAEALKDGYLHSDWQVNASNSGDSYRSGYSLRNISILRKYRILPVGWEQAAKVASDSTNPVKPTIGDLVSCFDPNDQYNQFSSDFSLDKEWCKGLIDPNWVLKAPLSYCSKEGAGAQILNKSVTPASGTDTDRQPSELNVVRADDYCADNKTCIKEKQGGGCEAYGYCNEERRTWNFGTDSCQAVDNTCESFAGTGGQAAAYLKNTLDYADCNAENSGCRQYALGGSYNAVSGTVAWDGARSIYLNKNLASCSSKDEACTGLLRVKAAWGTNLVMDADFASNRTDVWPLFNTNGSVAAAIVAADQEPGGANGRALKLVGTGAAGHGLYSRSGSSLLPVDFEVNPGQAYTVSADVYLAGGVSSVTLSIGNPDDGFSKTVSPSVPNDWQHITVTRPADTSYNEADFRLVSSNSNSPATFYVKNLKFEMTGWDTGYTAYGATTAGSAKFYEKLLPNYLESACYVDVASAIKNYNLKPNAPAACSAFARRCNKAEAGCELYTGGKNNFPVAAKVAAGDYCPGECVGYDVYISKGTYFNLSESANLIPNQAQTCSAAAVGCNEFTNLDTSAQGGEQREYYSSLKQCIKPSALECANFYVWEGTDGGPQLKAYTLKKDASGNPAVTADDSGFCNASIFNRPASDPGYNPDCREFYNAAGAVSYHLLSRTVTCSDDCHAYRLTDKNVDKSLAQTSCTGGDKHWDAAAGVCNVCLNGGLWDTAQNSCVYQAIPGEGQTCQAEDNGCREYNGNDGANVRLTAAYDFESGLGDWSSNCTNGVRLSAVSNSQAGHSLQYDREATCLVESEDISRLRLIERILAAGAATPVAQIPVGDKVRAGGSYSLKFIARTAGASNVNLQIYLLDPSTGAKAYFNTTGNVTVKSGGDWNLYQANLSALNHIVGGGELLVIGADGDFFFDNAVLSEVTDRYYLIKGSSQVPDSCFYDIANNYQGPNYNLGCYQYSDRGGVKHNLRQFTSLCSDSAVGCEQMIDTKNYASPYAAAWKDGLTVASCAPGDSSCASVPADSAIYAVYDSAKLCTAPNQGCSRLGEAQGGANLTGWSDVFKINSPDRYGDSAAGGSILCSAGAAGCEAWKTASGADAYFKNPGFAACSYRASQNATVSGKAWYKIAVKRCDRDGNGQINTSGEKSGAICSSDADCGHTATVSDTCVTDTNDYPCSVSYFKTIGTGGAGNQIPVPDQDAGLCNKAASGCTEYIDPVSQFSVNLVKNPGYAVISGVRENWGPPTPGATWLISGEERPIDGFSQVISLRPNTLYSLTSRKNGESGSVGRMGLYFRNGVKQIMNDNSLGATVLNLNIGRTNIPQAIIFNSLSNTAALVSGGDDTKIIEVKELAIDYQLQSNVEKGECGGLADKFDTGLVKFDNGCVMFNERSFGKDGLSPLDIDSYITQDGQTPTRCDQSVAGDCTSNALVKVRPDRICAKWLDCVTYIQDSVTKQKTCYAMGECDRLDDKGECANFTETAIGERSFDVNSDKNATGYSMLDKYDFGQMREVGVKIENGYDFEGDSSKFCQQTMAVSSTPCVAPIISEPSPSDSDLKKIATDYPAHGTAYLAVPTNFFTSPGGSTIPLDSGRREYYVSYLVNTRNSGVKARLTITDKDNVVLRDSETGDDLRFDSTAQGWERKINKFVLDGPEDIRIYLGSDGSNPSAGNYVYFDDIRIEPVLQVGDGQYASRDCRLYPTTDSLTCVSKDNNVVANGLEGYCLYYDPANPNSCLMWYPVDRIGAADNKVSAAGYNNIYPLYYCAEANGNFDVVEKRVAYHLKQESFEDKRDYCGRTYDDPGAFDGGGPSSSCYKHDDCSTCPSDYQTWISWQMNGTGVASVLHIMCVPKSGNLLSMFQTTTNHTSSITVSGDGNWEHCANQDFTVGIGKYNGLQGVEGYTSVMDPAIRVYDYDNRPDSEADLKKLTSDTGNDDTNLYHLTCNKFVQVVDESGNNKAWVDRVADNAAYANDTPNFFVDNSSPYKQYREGGTWPSGYDLDKYGRNNTEVIFGAAKFPEGFKLSDQSSRIPLRNWYSGNGNVLAGRPYGCDGDSCGILGYCSGDPTVFCLVGPSGANNTCGDKGTCTNLWDPVKRLPSSERHYASILSKLFLESYSAYRFDGSSYISDINVSYNDYTLNGSVPGQLPFAHSPQTRCTGGVRNSSDGIASFCPVFPVLSKVRLYYGDSVTPYQTDPKYNQPFDIQTKGIYRLEFNSKVDSQQQPLQSIEINWGDGHIQTITGQSQSQVEPHVFYHYYTQKGDKLLEVKISDNWNYFDRND